MTKPIAEVRLGEGEPVNAEDLAKIDLFRASAARIAEKFPGSIMRRRYKKGELVCREGEFGSTAFFILEGEATVSIRAPMAHVKTSGGGQSLLRRVKSALVRDRDDPRAEAGARAISVDAPVNLSTDRPMATLATGSLFGEMTCLSFYPRSATVTASTDCVMLEMLRNVLQILKRDPAFRARLESDYRDRAMSGHLRSVPLLAGLSDEFLERIRARVTLVSYEPGDVICREGEPADAFFLIRIGFVSVARAFPGGEMVLTYLSRGHAFGEMGLLGAGTREATCTALDHVEVVRIGQDDFRSMTEAFPQIRERLEAVAQERRAANVAHASSVKESRLDDYLEQGLMQAQSLLVIDLDRCTRCDVCVRACADTHDGVTRLVREGLRFDRYLIATSCRQCRDPVCMVGCPVGSIRRKQSLEILIEDWCIGCGLCANNCPYGNINMHTFAVEGAAAGKAVQAKAASAPSADAQADDGKPAPTIVQKAEPTERKKAITCDLCSHLRQPACVTACPHDAAARVEPRAFFSTRIGK
jgi:CRP-like cAMP-binding protein